MEETFQLAMAQGLRSRDGTGILCIDLYTGSHPANVFDKGVPVKLVNLLAADHARVILSVLGVTIYGQGKHINDALNLVFTR